MSLLVRSLTLAVLSGCGVLASGCSKSDDAMPSTSVQVQTGAVVGQVSPANALSRVSAVLTGGGNTYGAVINASGTYSFAALPVGNYAITYVAAPGYLNPGPQTAAVTANNTVTLPPLTVPTNRVQLLTAVNWRVTAATRTEIMNGATTVVDVYAATPPCNRDDFYRFNANRRFVRDNGPTKCSPAEAQTFDGTWDFAANESQLVLNAPGASPMSYDLVALTATTLEIRNAPLGASYTNRITFTAF